MEVAQAINLVKYYMSKIGRIEKQTVEIKEAKELAIKALKKTEATNIVEIKQNQGVLYCCPSCRNTLGVKCGSFTLSNLPKYCGECGQALKLGGA